MLTPDTWHIYDQDRTRVDVAIQSITNQLYGDSDKGLFEHHMLKEIYEQPESLENAMRGRLSDADSTLTSAASTWTHSNCAAPSVLS